jgi:hypothetical protein
VSENTVFVNFGDGGQIGKGDEEWKRPVVFVDGGENLVIEKNIGGHAPILDDDIDERVAVEACGGGHCGLGWTWKTFLCCEVCLNVWCRVAIFVLGRVYTWLVWLNKELRYLRVLESEIDTVVRVWERTEVAGVVKKKGSMETSASIELL